MTGKLSLVPRFTFDFTYHGAKNSTRTRSFVLRTSSSKLLSVNSITSFLSPALPLSYNKETNSTMLIKK